MLEKPSLITSRGRRLLFLRPAMPSAGRTPALPEGLPFHRSIHATDEMLRVARLAPPPGPQLVVPAPHTLQWLSRQQGLAHDTRNALCSLQLLVGYLREPGILSPEHHHALDSLEAVGATLGQLVQQALATEDTAPALSNVSASQEAFATKNAPPALEAIPSAGESIQACASLLRAIAGPAVQVYISSEHALPPLTIAAENLQRILMNLIKNAAEAMPQGGAVRITARRALSRARPAVLIHVSDDGEGIPHHALPRIFEPGFSSKPAGGPGEPCGLGLAIVRELVEAVGGAIQVASTRHRGTTFELRLPTLAAAGQLAE